MWQATGVQAVKSAVSGASRAALAAFAALWLAAAPVQQADARGPAPWVGTGSAAPVQAVEDGIALADLPGQGRQTYRLILQGGPFPYDKDGAVFGNRERLLPPMPRGFYREYTVKTPRQPGRGARRIVCGGLRPVQPEACYYSADHYSSFRKIVP